MEKKVISILSFLLILTFNLNGQSSEVDSLKKLLTEKNNDTIKLKALTDLNWIFSTTDPKLSKEYGFQELHLANKKGDQKWIAQSYNDIGISNYKLGLLDSALLYYNKSLNIRKKINDKNLIASSLSKIGVIYQEMGDFNKSLESHLNALKVFEEAGNENYMAMTLNNISVIYDKLNNVDKIILYGEKALAIHVKNRNEYEAAFCYANLASAYQVKKNISKANEYLLKGLDLFTKYGDKSNEAAVLNSIGLNLRAEHKDKEALVYYQKAYNIAEKIEDKLSLALYGNNLGSLCMDLGNYLQAEKYGLASIKNTEPSNKYQLSLSFRLMANIYAFLNNGTKSKYFLDRYVSIKDSLYSIESSNQIAEMEVKYETEKKDKELIIKDAEIVKQQADASKKAFQRNGFLIGFVVILVFLTLLFRLFLQKKKANQLLAQQNVEIKQQNEEITAQRDEIEAQRDRLNEQKELLELHEKEITDSINYARRIQQALLPTGEYAQNILGDHFILFKPKDIVSGDFYWSSRINDWLIIAVADCTGHGVPGAFMSMLGISFLNEIVRKKEVTKASDVLDQLRASVIDALQQKGKSGEQKDGMDIALCAINMSSFDLQFAGANNPLYIVRKHTNKEKPKLAENNIQLAEIGLEELKGDKMPIGIHLTMTPFSNHITQLQKGDCIYLMSDGFEDQFGGPCRRKYMTRNLKKKIVEISDNPMSEQGNILSIELENWKGDNEQIDDITMLGLKI